MNAIFVAITVAFLVFGAVIFAIHRGFSVKAALEWLGLKLTFEAQKTVSPSPKSAVRSGF
jgi:hypothetical protein